MKKFRWLLLTLLALTVLSAWGIPPVSAATVSQPLDLSGPSSTTVGPPIGTYSTGTGGGNTDGDPDDIIEGNRVVAVVTGLSASTGITTLVVVSLSVRAAGVILMLRRMLP